MNQFYINQSAYFSYLKELHAHLNGSISMTTMNKLLKKRLQRDSDCGLLTGWHGDKEFTKENFSK
jgi:hypothetical protein